MQKNFLTSWFILCLENLAIYKSTDPFPSNNWQYFLPLEANCWPTQVVLVCCYQSFVNVISTAKFSLYVFQVLGLWGLSNSPRRRNSLKEKRHTFITKKIMWLPINNNCTDPSRKLVQLKIYRVFFQVLSSQSFFKGKWLWVSKSNMADKISYCLYFPAMAARFVKKTVPIRTFLN